MSRSTTLHAHKIHLTYRDELLSLAGMMSKFPFLGKQERELRTLADNLQSPFKIAIFGRMKTGKSTLINSLIGKQLAIIGAEEATATINRIVYSKEEKRLRDFTIHWNDQPPEDCPLERLRPEWTGKSEEVHQRTNRTLCLDLYSDAEILKDIYIIDTPGTDSTDYNHEKIAKQFINGQEAEALLYVFRPNGSALDVKDLQAFRDGCLPDSSIDNSVGVLHRWDEIYWTDGWESIEHKANIVHDFMKDLISVVVPVSAPLALIARTAPESFWHACKEILSEFDSEKELTKRLLKDTLWNKVPHQAELCAAAEALGCPWASFRVMLRHLYRNPESDARASILELSGIPKLEELLDKQILSVRSVIQQQQNCARARKVIEDTLLAISKEQTRLNADIEMQERIYNLIPDSEFIPKNWLSNHLGHQKWQSQQLKEDAEKLDRTRIRIRDWVDSIINAHELLPWLQQATRLRLPDSFVDICTRILNSLLPSGAAADDITWEEFMKVQPILSRLTMLPGVEDKHKAERLKDCIMVWASKQNLK